MNLNLAAFTVCAALSLTVDTPVLAQFQPDNLPNTPPNVPTDIPSPGELPQSPNLPNPTQGHGYPNGNNRARQGSRFQGFSRSFNFQEALADALNKAKRSLKSQTNTPVHFTVVAIDGSTGGGQQDNQLRVTIVVVQNGNSSRSNLPSRPDIMQPNLPNNIPTPNSLPQSP